MRSISFRRRAASSSADSNKLCSPFVWLVGTVTAALLLLIYLQRDVPAGGSSRRLSRFPFSRRHSHMSRPIDSGERLGNIFHSDLLEKFKFNQGLDQALQKDLVATLKQMEGVGITTVAYSCPWNFFEAKEGRIQFDHFDALLNMTCSTTKLKVAMILDLVRAPGWVFDRWPDAKAMDSHKREYTLLSWFHPEAYQQALETLTSVVSYLANKHPGCIAAVQPVFNNQYEARYTQEHDCYQDYSPPAAAAFRQWLQARQPLLGEINSRWGTSYSSWPLVEPLVLEAGAVMGVDNTARYWDFIRFRESVGAEVFNRACAAVQAAGLRCFHHVPEFFTVLDAVYGSTMVKHIATSPHTDFLILDSNFYTSYGTIMNPSRLRLSIAAAIGYGKPVLFEAAVERSPTVDLLKVGFQHALASGAQGIGITNWLSRYDMSSELSAAMHPELPACRVTELVGLFVHLDSCAAFHGLQWEWARKDPIHDFIQDLADTLGSHCETELSVHIELHRFYEALPEFDRIIFVEPLVLTSSAEHELYGAIKSQLHTVPHEIMHLPINRTGGVLLTVLQDL